MSMAIPEIKETPKPKYIGTVVCERCHAEYKPTQWIHGYSDKGTAGQFNGVFITDCYTCPVCRHKAQ